MKNIISKDIKKLKKLITEYLGVSRNEIRSIFGTPSKKSDNEAWLYRKFRLNFFNNEVIFIFEDNVVVDISINKYFLWVEIKSIFYMEYQNPEYWEIYSF